VGQVVTVFISFQILMVYHTLSGARRLVVAGSVTSWYFKEEDVAICEGGGPCCFSCDCGNPGEEEDDSLPISPPYFFLGTALTKF